MPLHILGHERAQGNHAQVVLLRESEHRSYQFRPDALPLKCLGNFGVYQAKQMPRLLVNENGSFPVNMEFEAVERVVVGDFTRNHDCFIVLGDLRALLSAGTGKDLLGMPEKQMVRPERFELPTFWFVARRSIQLS